MAKKEQYQLVEKIEQIQPILNEYRKILVNKEGNLINKLSNFDYWYFFPGIDIFAPNLFLAYQEMATEPYPKHPRDDYGMYGGKAKDRLESLKLFDEVTGDEKEKLKEKLEEFANDYNFKVKKRTKEKVEIHILKLKSQFINLFINNEIVSKENNNYCKKNINKNNISEQHPKVSQTKKNVKSISSLVIAQRCEKLVSKINKINIIFNEDENTRESWMNIREPVESVADFLMFINELFIIVKEYTRDKNPNFKPGEKNGPYYNHRFPDNAKRIILFKEEVANIRNYKGHKKNKENKLKYIEACNKYLHSELEREPVEEEEFKRLQLSILSEFEVSLEELLDILLKKDKNK